MTLPRHIFGRDRRDGASSRCLSHALAVEQAQDNGDEAMRHIFATVCMFYRLCRRYSSLTISVRQTLAHISCLFKYIQTTIPCLAGQMAGSLDPHLRRKNCEQKKRNLHLPFGSGELTQRWQRDSRVIGWSRGSQESSRTRLGRRASASRLFFVCQGQRQVCPIGGNGACCGA